jgi:hypothetical protein
MTGEVEMDVLEYRSPMRKLLNFFKKSRDQWKAKCQEAKHRNKLLANQTRAVEQSRDQWKLLARTQAEKIAELELELKKKSAQSSE